MKEMHAGTSDFDIAIVGLGPVGAVAANLAGAAGFKTLVLERAQQPYLKPRAIVFDAEIMRIFHSIGLSDAISKATRPLEGSIYLGADRKPIRTFRARGRAHELAWYPSNLFYQPELEGLLREGLQRFPNVTVRLDEDVITAKQTDGRCVLKTASFEAHAKYVLACDGASSTIRKSLKVPLDDIGFEERWLVLDTLVSGPMRWPKTHEIPEEVTSERFSLMVCDPARPSTLIPGAGRHRRWEYMLMPNERDDDVVGENWLHEQLALWIDPKDVEIIRAAVYKFRALIAQDWRTKNIFLLGDAAHQTPPFYGQGMCHGIRDASQLMWKLRMVMEGVAPASILDTYQVEREPHVREIIAASVAAGSQVCKLDPAAAAARDVEFRRIEVERANKPVAMTDVVPPIRGGIIDARTGGMRLPEFACRSVDGATHRLDDLLAGRFSIVSTATVDLSGEVIHRWLQINGQDITLAAPDAPGSKMRDVDGRLAQWLAQQHARYIIVRPDRYVYATAADERALHERLEELLIHLGQTEASSISFSKVSLS